MKLDELEAKKKIDDFKSHTKKEALILKKAVQILSLPSQPTEA